MKAAVAGTELYYTLHGRGRPLLVMHGGPGLDHAYFRPWLDALGERAQIIYYDHRGNGRSRRLEQLDGVGFDTWAADADALRAHLGHERIVLFGHSFGGCLAQEYALRFGQRLAGLILCCTFPALDYLDLAIDRARARGMPEQVEILLKTFGEPTADDRLFGERWSTIFPLYFHRPDAQVIRGLFASGVFSARAFYSGLTQLSTFNATSRLGAIRVPTLILNGADDWTCPLEHSAERLRDGIPNSTLVIFEKSGHYPFVEESERFVRVVAEWLARLP